MKNTFPCPNCGAPVDISGDIPEFHCDRCGEALAASSDGKLVLVHTLQTYVDFDNLEQDPGSQNRKQENPANVLSIFYERKKRSAEIAYERLGQEKKFAYRGFFFGILFVVFGGILLSLAYARYLLRIEDWLNFAALGFGLIFVPLGVYVMLWFALTLRSWSKNEREIEKEIRGLE